MNKDKTMVKFEIFKTKLTKAAFVLGLALSLDYSDKLTLPLEPRPIK